MAAARELTKRQLDVTLSALADPARRGVVDLLKERPRRAGELAQSLGVSAPALSRHLRVLRKGGLVEEGRGDPDDARVRIYQLRRERFAQLGSWLAEVEEYWTEQLQTFSDYAASVADGRER